LDDFVGYSCSQARKEDAWRNEIEDLHKDAEKTNTGSIYTSCPNLIKFKKEKSHAQFIPHQKLAFWIMVVCMLILSACALQAGLHVPATKLLLRQKPSLPLLRPTHSVRKRAPAAEPKLPEKP
jgi:hypothetical protein